HGRLLRLSRVPPPSEFSLLGDLSCLLRLLFLKCCFLWNI
ncbi:hypothetical protein TNCT_575201, partial [Trichonephila clavata]